MHKERSHIFLRDNDRFLLHMNIASSLSKHKPEFIICKVATFLLGLYEIVDQTYKIARIMYVKTKKSKTRMIRWRLRVLMAEKNINNKSLAKLTGLHPTTISRLKNTDELKQVSGDVLNSLCNALVCTPNDLIEFTLDDDFDSATKPNLKTVSINQKNNRPKIGKNQEEGMESAA